MGVRRIVCRTSGVPARLQVVKLQRDSNTFFLALVDTLADGERVMALQIEQVDICGSPVTCTLPQLFAAYRVLLRLIWPRHPPYALSFLTFLLRFFSFFQRSFLRFHVVVKVRG